MFLVSRQSELILDAFLAYTLVPRLFCCYSLCTSSHNERASDTAQKSAVSSDEQLCPSSSISTWPILQHSFPSIFGSGKKRTPRDEDDDDGDDTVVDAKIQFAGTPKFSAADPIGQSHPVSAFIIIFPLLLTFSRANWSYKL